MYVVPLSHILGKLPLIPADDSGTIPSSMYGRKATCYPLGNCASDNVPGSGSRLFYLNTWAMTWPTDYRVSNPGPDPDSESESLTGADDLANSQDPDSESETQAGADDSVNSPQESCSDIGAMEALPHRAFSVSHIWKAQAMMLVLCFFRGLRLQVSSLQTRAPAVHALSLRYGQSLVASDASTCWNAA